MNLLVFTGDNKEFHKEAVVKTRKTHMRNNRKNSTMCLLWEQVEREEQSGEHDGNLEAVEEEKEDEELDSHSYELHQPWLVIGVELSNFFLNKRKYLLGLTIKRRCWLRVIIFACVFKLRVYSSIFCFKKTFLLRPLTSSLGFYHSFIY